MGIVRVTHYRVGQRRKLRKKPNILVVKRKGSKERFDERKIYASCYSACLNAKLDPLRAEHIAEEVTEDIRDWITGKEVTTTQLFKQMIRTIKKYNKKVAKEYEKYRKPR